MATGNEATQPSHVTSEQPSGAEVQKEEHDEKALLGMLQQEAETGANVTLHACVSYIRTWP